MPRITRSPLLASLTAAGVLAAVPALAAATAPPHPLTSQTATAAQAEEDGEADEILTELGEKWTLSSGKITGTLTNDNGSQLTGTAKLTVRPRGKTLTIAKGAAFSVGPQASKKITLTLTKTGKDFFKHRSKASADLKLDVKADTRSGDITETITVRKKA